MFGDETVRAILDKHHLIYELEEPWQEIIVWAPYCRLWLNRAGLTGVTHSSFESLSQMQPSTGPLLLAPLAANKVWQLGWWLIPLMLIVLWLAVRRIISSYSFRLEIQLVQMFFDFILGNVLMEHDPHQAPLSNVSPTIPSGTGPRGGNGNDAHGPSEEDMTLPPSS
jgi:hypothetical protein